MNIKGYKIIKSTKSIFLSRIKDHPQGWAFSAHDFIDNFTRCEIDDSLSTLTEEGEIRRIIRGIYDYPIYDELLKTNAAPAIDQVANALARKFNWKIYPDGIAALNTLGLSEYVDLATHNPDNNIYITNGPSKKFCIGNQCIEFKHKSQKEFKLKNANTVMVVQAIKAVGKNQITPEFLEKLNGKFTISEWDQIKADASYSTGWVYKTIREFHKFKRPLKKP